MKEDAEIIIGVEVDTQKIDKELEKILDQYSKKKIELDLELKNQSNIRKSLVELDQLMNKNSLLKTLSNMRQTQKPELCISCLYIVALNLP